MVDDEEIERAIRRDPRFAIRMLVLVALMLALIGASLVAVGRLDLGKRAARGFSAVTESPPPADDERR